MTFQQAGFLVGAISQEYIAERGMLLVNISKLTSWNHSEGCYLMLDVFRTGTMNVEKRRFKTKWVRIRYFEANWPQDPVAKRIEPLRGSMAACTNKRHHPDDDVHQKNFQKERCQSYAFMIHNLMSMIQDYLVLSDDKEQSGALNSRRRGSEENRICIWLEECE